MDVLTQRLSNWLIEHADECVAALAELVRIPSLVGQEAAAQDWMAQQYRAAGLEVDVFEADRAAVQAHPAFVDSGIPFAGRPNVVGRWRGVGGGRSLILNGHTDVVSPEPLSAWSCDPFGAQVVIGEDGRRRMYGRGALDMKGGLIANLFALRALQACGVRLRGDLILESVIEEEAGGGGGTLACFLRGHRADGFIASEPHWDDITIAHPGILYFRIVVPGRGAHAGRAHHGVNAAVEAAPIIAMLGEWDRERAERLHHELFERLEPSARRSCHLNVGVVRAGDWPSSVPSWAEIEVRLSFLPGETEAGIREEVAARVNAVAQRSSWLREHPPKLEFFGWHTDPWLQDERHPFVQEFAQCVRALRQDATLPTMRPWAGSSPPILAGGTAGLDTRFAGLYGVPALAWGPKGGNMHAADEYVDLDSVLAVAHVLAVFAARWCGVAADESGTGDLAN